MIKLPTPIRPLLALAAMAAVALGASACGTSTADVENGRILFIERCGTCHTLAEAGTTATVGPNLDDLRPPQSLVLNAIAQGRARGVGRMPAALLQGQDAQDVAAYVSKVAGRQ